MPYIVFVCILYSTPLFSVLTSCSPHPLHHQKESLQKMVTVAVLLVLATLGALLADCFLSELTKLSSLQMIESFIALVTSVIEICWCFIMSLHCLGSHCHFSFPTSQPWLVHCSGWHKVGAQCAAQPLKDWGLFYLQKTLKTAISIAKSKKIWNYYFGHLTIRSYT